MPCVIFLRRSRTNFTTTTWSLLPQEVALESAPRHCRPYWMQWMILLEQRQLRFPAINKSEAIQKVKKEANDKEVSAKKKKELSEAEKEYKSLRKQIQDKLIKFATRVPVFMYLTDFREQCLKDVIAPLEPGLFKKVTGLAVKDFELLVSLGVFNSALMNDAVYKFKRYEDPSLNYTGINKHEGEDVGLYDTVLSQIDYKATFENVADK